MKSFLNIEEITKTQETTRKGKDGNPVMEYPEAGIADMFAAWLVTVCDGKQNKYVNCHSWDSDSKLKKWDEITINDLTPQAQAFVFTLVYLTAATESEANIPATGKASICQVEKYNIPNKGNLSKVVKYSHKVGISELLAEKDKFIAETKCAFKVDKNCILSPAEMQTFLDELAGSGQKFETTACTKDGVYTLNDLAGFWFGDDHEMYEATLIEKIKITVEMTQILGITSTALEGLGRKQEADTKSTLLMWLTGKQKDEEK